MLAYGLFLAKLNSGGAEVTLANAKQYVPGSFRLIRELVQFLDDLDAPEYDETRWVVTEILSIVNGLDLAAIHNDLSFKHRRAMNRQVRVKDEEEHRLFERDPFIYFYEDFLAKYDANMKKSRGVYYTPPPVVNFIVRAVDDILKDAFGIADGLADHNRVTVLDFACGTGTFLLEVFQQIFGNIGGADSGKANLIVRDHMLKNVFGFEYFDCALHDRSSEAFPISRRSGASFVQRRAFAGVPDQHAGAGGAAEEFVTTGRKQGGRGSAES